MEGGAAFYDATGAYRDMIVTHLFQVLAFVAMEPPVSLSAKHLRDEKEKVCEAMKPIDVRHVVRGQYEGYRSEPGVAADSQTETMVAVRAEVDNWRWHGVPFFLRSGKAMGASRQIIVLGFQPPPLRMFPAHQKDTPYGLQNEIEIDFADPGAIKTYFLSKVPGAELSLANTEMGFYYKDSFAAANALESSEPRSLASRPIISSRVSSSRLPVGSSASSTAGALTRARAIATRCCWPPDSSPGRCCARSPSPTLSSASFTLTRRSAWPTASGMSAASTFSAAVSVGTRLKVWKMKPNELALTLLTPASGACARPAPPKSSRPRVGRSRPPSRCSSLVLPWPVLPC